MNATLLLAVMASMTPAVAVTGACPSAEAVTSALASALGSQAWRDAADVPTVIDEGDRFTVRVRAQTRQYADPGRDCDERARAAAVFIALALNPPIVPPGGEPGVPAGAPQVTAAPQAAPAPAWQRWIDPGAAARFDGAPSAGVSAAFGVEARAAVGWRWLGVVATAGALAPTESKLSSVTVRQQRFPLSVAVTARRGVAQRLAVAAAFGAALVPLTLRGESLDGASQATRVDAGVRLAFEVRLRATQRLAPFIGVHAELFPRAYQLDVAPFGTIGSTGRLWVGASVGLSFETTATSAR